MDNSDHKEEINLLDEEFVCEYENEHYYISHKKCSLVGMGKTIEEAKVDLIKESNDFLFMLDNCYEREDDDKEDEKRFRKILEKFSELTEEEILTWKN